jgi:hypothetical protein
MSLTTFSEDSILKGVRYDAKTKCAAVYDIINKVTGCGVKSISIYWHRMLEVHPDLLTKCLNIQFPGRGQKETPTATVNVLVEIIMLCPGKIAKTVRMQAAKTLCRAMAGDLTLVDQILERHTEVAGTNEQAIILEGTGVTPDQANMGMTQETKEEHMLGVKRARAEIDALELSNRDRRIDFLAKAKGLLIENHPNNILEPRMAILIHDRMADLIAGEVGSIIGSISISSVAGELGRVFNNAQLCSIGKKVAQSYRNKYGKNPERHTQWVDGRATEVNSYTMEDKAMIVDIIKTL